MMWGFSTRKEPTMCDKCERLEKINAILVRALQRQKVRDPARFGGGSVRHAGGEAYAGTVASRRVG
jgi:hypothetical protein